MNNHQLSKLTVILLASTSLLACNGGNSSSNSSSATTANPLQQYIDLLSYTPANGKQLSTGGSNQQSFSTPGGIKINSVDIKYYSGADCSGTTTLATTLNGPSTPPAGTYTSSNASNYALCDKYSGNCAGLYNAVHANPPAIRSMQYTYNLESGVFTTQCLSNANNDPYGSGAFETILDYSVNPPVACTSGSSCRYSQAYAATSLFTQIALPQTGQLYCVPGTSFTQTCGSGYTSIAGTDGYGRNIPSYGDYIPYGVAWAYNGTGALNPVTRFTAGMQADGTTACPSGEEVRNDNLTGLMWVQNPSSTTYKWRSGSSPNYTYPAQASIDAMNASGYCGYTDWRLPNINELASLVNRGVADTGGWLNAQGFSNVQTFYYWSSTTYAAGTIAAWNVNINSGGNVGFGNKASLDYYVLPVRGTTALPAQIPQTGQTTSYAAGDDGSLQKGTAGTTASGRFMVGSAAEDNCITDSQTGLMWPKNGIIGFEATNGDGPIAQPDYANTTPDLNTLSWTQALTAVANMNSAATKLCGHSDWRLPNSNELRSLINYGQPSTAAWLNDSTQGFSNVQAKYYLSSTIYAVGTSTSNASWIVNMNGSVNSASKANVNHVWPVRGGQ